MVVNYCPALQNELKFCLKRMLYIIIVKHLMFMN